MEAVILIGVQGSGKTTFYLRRFFETHVRISLDMLRTRRRERILLMACVEAKQPFVIDNTNPRRAERAVFIEAAKVGGFRVAGYWFEIDLKLCKQRNAQRRPGRVVPLPGLLGTYKRLERPSVGEDFDELHRVRSGPEGEFIVEAWRDEQ